MKRFIFNQKLVKATSFEKRKLYFDGIMFQANYAPLNNMYLLAVLQIFYNHKLVETDKNEINTRKLDIYNS